VPGAGHKVTHRAHFVEASRNEGLPSEPRMHGHHDDVIEYVHHAAERVDRRVGIDGRTRPYAEFPDASQRLAQIGRGFHMHRDGRGAGARKRIEIPIGVGDHQVHIERQGSDPLDRRHHERTHGDVRHKVAIHHVDMNEPGAATDRRQHLFAQTREVRRQN